VIESEGGPAPGNDRAITLRNVAFYVSAVATALFMVRLLGASWNTHFPATWPDAAYPREGYLAVAAKSPFRPSFYFAFRPIGYPLLLWMCARNTQLIVVVQTSLYCAGIAALCAAALRVMNSRVIAVVTMIVFAGTTIQAKYAMWNTQILSESLALSLGFASLAAWWRFAAAPSAARARWGWAFLVAWLLVRDAHVLPATTVIVPVALGTAWLAKSLDRRVRRTLAIGALIVPLVAGYSYFSQSASHRAQLSVHNDVGIRVLPDAELRKWFTSHGMPLDAALRTRTGKSGLEDDFYLSRDSAFAKYRHWARHSGSRAIARSLVELAPHYGHLLYDDLPTILEADVRFYDTQDVYQRMPREIPLQIGGPVTRTGLTVWLVLGAVALITSLAIALWKKRGIGLLIFGVTALTLTITELYTTWGADPVEMPRHVVGALSRFSLILALVIASGVDAAVAMRRAARDA
jgi:hypothetical protein